MSRPGEIKVREVGIGGGGEELLPGVGIHVKLEVYDQFGQFMGKERGGWGGGGGDDNDDGEDEDEDEEGEEEEAASASAFSESYVTASLDVRGSNGAVLEGARTNRTEGGVVTFEDLRVNQEGNFTLRFYLTSSKGEGEGEGEGDGDTNDNKKSIIETSLKLRIGQDPLDKMLGAGGVCSGLYESFSCMGGSGANGITGGGKLGLMEACAVIPFPESIRRLGCVDILQEAGFDVAFGWRGEMFLWSSREIEQMGTGTDLVTKEMNFWERLGVEFGASKSERRKAYHQKSLLWHPDRWAQFPAYKARAGEVFDLIVEAYQMLNKEEDDRG